MANAEAHPPLIPITACVLVSPRCRISLRMCIMHFFFETALDVNSFLFLPEVGFSHRLSMPELDCLVCGEDQELASHTPWYYY
jgi:hypothetical protein